MRKEFRKCSALFKVCVSFVLIFPCHELLSIESRSVERRNQIVHSRHNHWTHALRERYSDRMKRETEKEGREGEREREREREKERKRRV